MKTKIISSLLAVAILVSSVPVYAMEATESVESVESIEAVEETESTEEVLLEETESTEAVEEVLAETTEVTESTELIESTESVEVTESTESTDSVEEGTTEETVEDTESIDSVDLATSTEETTEEATEEVESTEEAVEELEVEVSDEMTMGYYDSFETVGHENLVVGKTYKVTLKEKQEFVLNNVYGSTKSDVYAGFIKVLDDGSEADAYIMKGTYSCTSEFLADDSGEEFVWNLDNNNNFQEVPNFNGVGTIMLEGNGIFEFTIVRLPSEVPDKDKLNIIPNADGTVTCKWQPTSDCDGMAICVKTDYNEVLVDTEFTKETTEYTFKPSTTHMMHFMVLPYVFAGDKDIYGDLQWTCTDFVTPVTVNTIKNPTVKVYESYLDCDGSWVKVYDETGKRIYNDSNERNVLKGKLEKYAGETLKVVSYREVDTEDGQGNEITLRSKGSKPVYVDIPFDTSTPEWNCSWEGDNGAWGIDCCRVYGAEKYEVQYKLGKDSKWKKLVTTEDYEINLTNLKSGVYYFRFRCTTTTSAGKTITTKWSKSERVDIRPNKVKGIKATSKKTKKTPQAKVSWKKQSGVTGYEVYVSTSKKGKFYKVKGSVKSTAKTYKGKITCTVNGKNKTIKLKSGKTYYFKVRAYKKSPGNKTLSSSYSSVAKVKIK